MANNRTTTPTPPSTPAVKADTTTTDARATGELATSNDPLLRDPAPNAAPNAAPAAPATNADAAKSPLLVTPVGTGPGADAGQPNPTQKDALETVKSKESTRPNAAVDGRFDTEARRGTLPGMAETHRPTSTEKHERPTVKNTRKNANQPVTGQVQAKTEAEALARTFDNGDRGNVSKPARPLDQIMAAAGRARQIAGTDDPARIREIRDQILEAEQREPNTSANRMARQLRDRRVADRQDSERARDPFADIRR